MGVLVWANRLLDFAYDCQSYLRYIMFGTVDPANSTWENVAKDESMEDTWSSRVTMHGI